MDGDNDDNDDDADDADDDDDIEKKISLWSRRGWAATSIWISGLMVINNNETIFFLLVLDDGWGTSGHEGNHHEDRIVTLGST